MNISHQATARLVGRLPSAPPPPDDAEHLGMDRLRVFLEAVRAQGAKCPFRGLLHVLVGRRVSLADGTPVSSGMTWREAAAALKKYRWDREAVRELGLDPKELPPRDREKFWYTAIARAAVGNARAEAEAFIAAVRELGYVVGPGPGEDEGQT